MSTKKAVFLSENRSWISFNIPILDLKLLKWFFANNEFLQQVAVCYGEFSISRTVKTMFARARYLFSV
jgi:hypothetical protein